MLANMASTQHVVITVWSGIRGAVERSGRRCRALPQGDSGQRKVKMMNLSLKRSLGNIMWPDCSH